MRSTRAFLVASLAGLLLSPLGASALTVSWSGAQVDNTAADPTYLPSGQAVFTLSGTTLTLVLTSTNPIEETGVPVVLTGLTWDLPTGIVLTPVSASAEEVINAVSGATLSTGTDVSDKWLYNDDLGVGVLGEVGVLAVFQAYGAFELYTQYAPLYLKSDPDSQCMNGASSGTSCNLQSINGSNWGIVSDAFDGSTAFPNISYVQNEVTFTWTVSGGTLAESDISGVMAVFGQQGQPPVVPEPGSIAVFSIGLLTAGALIRRRTSA